MGKPRFTWIAFAPSCRNWRRKAQRISTGVAFNLYFGVLFVEVRHE